MQFLGKIGMSIAVWLIKRSLKKIETPEFAEKVGKAMRAKMVDFLAVHHIQATATPGLRDDAIVAGCQAFMAISDDELFKHKCAANIAGEQPPTENPNQPLF
jgi:hypothetical protein